MTDCRRDSQWDNGMSPGDALDHALDVRQSALSTLDERTLMPFQPYSELRNLLPPVWLWHHYEVEAAAKTLGGVEFLQIIKDDPCVYKTSQGASKASQLTSASSIHFC